MTIFTPSSLDYLRKLHGLAYVANKADAPELAEPWQTSEMAHTHVNALLEIVRSMMSDHEFSAFLDLFGDFESFVHFVTKGTAA